MPSVLGGIADDPRHRRIVTVLADRTEPVTERELARRLSARETGESPSNVPGDECQRIRIALHHRHLPKLASAGLIDRRDDGVVPTDRLAHAPTETPLSGHPDLDVPPGAALATLIARPARLHVASAVADAAGPLALADLVHRVANQNPRAEPVDERRLRARLHHVDLPKLDAAGLVAFDPEAATVEAEPPLGPVLEVAADWPDA